MPYSYRKKTFLLDALKSQIGDRSEGINDHLREVAIGTLAAIGVRILTAAFQLLLSVAIARTLGAHGTGIYYLTFAITWILSDVSRLGIDNVLVRQIAVNSSKMEWVKLKGAVLMGVKIVIFSSAAFSLVLFFTAPLLANDLLDNPELVQPLKFASLAILPMASLLLVSQMLKGFRKILQSQLVQSAMIPGLTTIGVLVIGPSHGSIGAIWALVVATALTSLLAFVFWYHATPMLRRIRGEFSLRSLFHRSIPLFWFSIMVIIINESSFLILGINGSNVDAGIFAVAWRTSLLISFAKLAIESISAPKFAALHDKGDIKTLGTLCQDITFGLIVIVLPVLVGIIFFSQKIMTIFGQEFLSGVNILLIISIGRFITIVMGPASVLLIMTGYERGARNVITLSAIFAIIAGLILIPIYGALGAAITSGAALALNSIGAAILVRNYLGFWLTPSTKTLFLRLRAIF